MDRPSYPGLRALVPRDIAVSTGGGVQGDRGIGSGWCPRHWEDFSGKPAVHQGLQHPELCGSVPLHSTQLFCQHACSSLKHGKMHLLHGCTMWMQAWSSAVPVPQLQSFWAPYSSTDVCLLAWEVVGKWAESQGFPISPTKPSLAAVQQELHGPLSHGSATPVPVLTAHSSVPHRVYSPAHLGSRFGGHLQGEAAFPAPYGWCLCNPP